MHIKERLPGECGRDYALRVITDNIISLELAPKSRVNDREIAAALGLSRTPVREALLELAKVDVVQIYPQCASIIAPIDYDIMEEAYSMREILECAVVEKCCQLESISDLELLEENLKLQEFYLENRSPERLMELDNEFHKMLFAAVKMPHVHSLMGSITIHFDRVRRLSYQTVKEVKTVGMHKAILSAILERDSDKAVELMRTHLRNYTIEKEELTKKYPQYFNL